MSQSLTLLLHALIMKNLSLVSIYMSLNHLALCSYLLSSNIVFDMYMISNLVRVH